MATVDQAVCAEVQKRVDGNVSANTADIKDLTQRTELLEQINIKLGQITAQHDKALLDLEKRVVDIESKPGKHYEYLVQNIVQYIIIAILAMSKIFTK